MKTKIIDILNKIANGEEVPKKIKYDDDILIYDSSVDKYWAVDRSLNLYDTLSRFVGCALNDEVEIIEEDKKIEKIKMQGFSLFDVADKVNEIIDYLNTGDNE